MTSGKTIKQLEDEMLNGQKLQGPITAEEVNYMLKAKKMEDKWDFLQFLKCFVQFTNEIFFHRFPLFTAIHKICTSQIKPADLIDCIRNHPEHM